MTAKTSRQNRQLHALLADIAAQVKWRGRYWQPESWKRLIVESYITIERDDAREMGMPDPFPGGPVMLLEGLDGRTIVQLGQQTRSLTKGQMQGLIECTMAFAAEHDVLFSGEPKEDVDV